MVDAAKTPAAGDSGRFRLMTVIVLIMAVASLLIGEKVQAGAGLGWDGITYAKMVRGLDKQIAGGELSTYYAQRSLTPAVIRAALLALGTPFTNANIIRAFELWNALLAVGATLLWQRIAIRLRFGAAACWIGFAALFMNFAFAKQNFFYPVLTDMTALFLSMTTMLCTLERRRLALLATTVVAAFCWPTAALSGALLLLFRSVRGEGLWHEPVEPGAAPRRRRGLLAAGVAVLALYLLAVALTASGLLCPVLDRAMSIVVASSPAAVKAKIAGANACSAFAGMLTAVPTFALVGAAVLTLALAGLNWRALGTKAREMRPLDVLAAMLALLLPMIGTRLIANPALPNVSSPFALLKAALLPPEAMVLMPLVSVGVFWGPAVVLMMLQWRRFAAAARALGPGWVALLSFNLPFAVVGEPRFVTLAWPFLVVALVCAIDQQPVRRRFGWAFAAASLFFAQFWLPLNYLRWDRQDFQNLLVLPKQLYFMHYGLWMSWPAYVAQSLALLIVGIWLHGTWRREATGAKPGPGLRVERAGR